MPEKQRACNHNLMIPYSLCPYGRGREREQIGIPTKLFPLKLNPNNPGPLVEYGETVLLSLCVAIVLMIRALCSGLLAALLPTGRSSQSCCWCPPAGRPHTAFPAQGIWGRCDRYSGDCGSVAGAIPSGRTGRADAVRRRGTGSVCASAHALTLGIGRTPAVSRISGRGDELVNICRDWRVEIGMEVVVKLGELIPVDGAL